MDLNINTLIPEHAALWERVHLALHHQRLTQALLLLGAPHSGVQLFAQRLAAMLLCHVGTDSPPYQPCEQCSACLLLHAETHPDCLVISPEAEGGVIKVDQIRSLQEQIYQTPQCGSRLICLIDQAHKMNSAAANALLKILEEPPHHVHFILTAEQLNTIPATILSRTQRLIFPKAHHHSDQYMALGIHYPPESNRGKLYANRNEIILTLCDVIENKVSPCTAATQWSKFPLVDVLWLFYLIFSQALQKQLLHKKTNAEAIDRLTALLQPVALLHHFDTIHLILKKLSHNISINATLALEHLLIQLSQKAGYDR